MKKLLAIACLAMITASTYAFSPFDPNEKVLKSFNETFNTAQEVKWEEYPNYFTVSFVNSGIRSKVNYDKEGNMLSSIRYYNPQMLPLNIFNKLKKENSKKSLFGVTEVTFGNDVTYYVKMEDDKMWYTVKIDASGATDIVEKYKKA